MTKRADLQGNKIGKLTVLLQAPDIVTDTKRHTAWLCECECGQRRLVKTKHLLNGAVKSCGCGRRERASKLNLKHGLHLLQAYSSWHCMMKRCYNPNDISFPNYGGRGIKVCDEWHDVQRFVADMGEPEAGMSIERNDANADYCKDNCRWATRKEQNNNKRNTQRFVCLSIDEHSRTLTEWAEKTGIGFATLYARVHISGWKIEDALSTPVRN